MDVGSIIGQALALSLAVERSVEVAKIGYLKIKKSIFPRWSYEEITQNEKVLITVVISIALVFMGGPALLLQIPGVEILPIWVQSFISGLVISIGSNVFHTLYSIITSIKDNIESAGEPPVA